jgi:hypothetical protein
MFQEIRTQACNRRINEHLFAAKPTRAIISRIFSRSDARQSLQSIQGSIFAIISRIFSRSDARQSRNGGI